MPMMIKEDVFGLDITMDDTLRVNVAECLEKLGHVEPSDRLVEAGDSSNVAKELAVSTEFEQEVQGVGILCGFVQFENERMSKCRQKRLLTEDALYLLWASLYSQFVENLQCEHPPGLRFNHGADNRICPLAQELAEP